MADLINELSTKDFPTAMNAIRRLPPPLWTSNSDVSRCQGCNTAFSIVRRKHHCRGCGGILCSHCLHNKVLPHFGYTTAVRVCSPCASPVIINCSSPPTSGGTVYIYGFNLKPCQGPPINYSHHNRSGSSGVAVSIDNVVCRNAMVVDLPNTGESAVSVLSCQVGPGEGSGKEVLVAVGEYMGRSKLSFASPVIIDTEPIATCGGDMVIAGDNFGTTSEGIRVLIGEDSHCCTNVYLSIRHRVVQVTIPPGIGSDVPLRVEVSGLVSAVSAFSYRPPEISHISKAPLEGGPVHVAGKNFGSDAALLVVEIAGVVTRAKYLVPHSSIVVTVPAASLFFEGNDGKELPVTVRVGNQSCISMIIFGGLSDDSPLSSKSQKVVGRSNDLYAKRQTPKSSPEVTPLAATNQKLGNSSQSSGGKSWSIVKWVTSFVQPKAEVSGNTNKSIESLVSPRGPLRRTSCLPSPSPQSTRDFVTPLDTARTPNPSGSICASNNNNAGNNNNEAPLGLMDQEPVEAVRKQKSKLKRTFSEPNLQSTAICKRCLHPFVSSTLVPQGSSPYSFCHVCFLLIRYTALYAVDLYPPFDRDGVVLQSCLHNACYAGHEEIVEKLLICGAIVNAYNDDGWTAMHYACGGGNARVVSMLLRYGGSASLAGKDGNTPLHIAAENGRLEIVNILLREAGGCDVDAVTDKGYSAAQMASSNGHASIAALLSRSSLSLSVDKDDSPFSPHLPSPLDPKRRGGGVLGGGGVSTSTLQQAGAEGNTPTTVSPSPTRMRCSERRGPQRTSAA